MYIEAAAAAFVAPPAPRHTGPVPAILYRSAGVEAIYCSAVGQRAAQPLTLSGQSVPARRPAVTRRLPACPPTVPDTRLVALSSVGAVC